MTGLPKKLEQLRVRCGSVGIVLKKIFKILFLSKHLVLLLPETLFYNLKMNDETPSNPIGGDLISHK